MFEHAAHFAVLAFGQGQLDPLVARRAPLHVGVDRAVADALDLDPVEQVLELRLGDVAERPGAIGPRHAGGAAVPASA